MFSFGYSGRTPSFMPVLATSNPMVRLGRVDIPTAGIG
jgi:hypothetical protein